MRYPGGKNQRGTWLRIVNLIPPHRVYVEPFLGSGAILRAKLPAEKSFGVDLVAPKPALLQACEFHRGCGIDFLSRYPWTGDEFVYCDPPYLLSTRGGRRYYRHEMSDADHRRLLRVLLRIPAKVLLSGYASKMYDDALASWNREEFRAWTRNHKPRTEVLWFNYPRPSLLHDVRFVGENWRDRWRIEKRRRRLRAKFERMNPLERASLFSALVDVVGRDAAALAISGAEIRGLE